MLNKKHWWWIVGGNVFAVMSIGTVAFLGLNPKSGPAQRAVTTVESPATPESPVQAPTVANVDRTAAEAHVSRISQGKASVVEVFPGPDGFLGVVIATGPSKFIGWMPASRNSLLVGALFDQRGENVTQTAMVARGFASDAPPPAASAAPGAAPIPPQLAIQQAVEKTVGFVEGSSGPLVTAFVDFNCGFCREFYMRSRPMVARGTMRIRWVPVAILQADSLEKAAAVLSNPDPVGALERVESNQLALPRAVTGRVQESIGANNAVLNMLSGGNSSTPTLVIRKMDGTFDISPGLPQNLAEFIKNAAGT